jgi:hypothetical protein
MVLTVTVEKVVGSEKNVGSKTVELWSSVFSKQTFVWRKEENRGRSGEFCADWRTRINGLPE